VTPLKNVRETGVSSLRPYISCNRKDYVSKNWNISNIVKVLILCHLLFERRVEKSDNMFKYKFCTSTNMLMLRMK